MEGFILSYFYAFLLRSASKPRVVPKLLSAAWVAKDKVENYVMSVTTGIYQVKKNQPLTSGGDQGHDCCGLVA